MHPQNSNIKLFKEFSKALPTLLCKHNIKDLKYYKMKKGIHPENYRMVAFKDMSNGELIERMENTRQEFGEFFNLKDKGMIDDSVFLDRQSTLTENMDVMAHELRHRGMEYADLQNEGKDVNVLKSDKNDELAARMGDLKHGDGIYKEMAQEYKESSRIIGPDRLYNKLEEDFREVLKDMRPQVKRSFLDKIMSYIYN